MNPQILQRYAHRPLPRYTSYPTAPHFEPGFGDTEYRAWLSAIPQLRPVSLYLHVPFCRAMCWYCGCNTSVTRREEPVDRYVDALHREIDMVADALPARLRAGFVHFGGGTPTAIGPRHFLAVMDRLRSHFSIEADAEIAIEIDPRTLEPAVVDSLAESGVNRASLGVQSFDPVVQKAINRVQTFDQTRMAMERLRAAEIPNINFDLIYGLPHQSLQSCIDTVAHAVSLRPDRLSVFGYAHVPAFKPHQRRIDTATLPGGAERHAQAQAIAGALRLAGYVQVGLDHFALPGDSLAIAAARGGLHRNFQGYTTDSCESLLAFGASAIGRLPHGFVQNATRVGDYQRFVDNGELPTTKARAFAGEDRLRGAIIERIMCDYAADVGSLCEQLGGDADELIRLPGLQPLLADGIAVRERHRIHMPEAARPLVRVLAAAFDEYLGQGTVRHSRAV